MKQNSKSELKRLNEELLENVFNVYQTEDGMYYYNLLQSVAFPQNLPKSLFDEYDVVYGDTWPYISYKTLKSPNLWWLIMLANNIENPLVAPKPGTTLKIPIQEIIKRILLEIIK